MGTIYSNCNVFHSDYGMCDLRLCHDKKLDVVFDCCAFFACRVACICTFFQRREQRNERSIARYQHHHASFFSGVQRCFEIAPYLISGKQYCRFIDCSSMGNIRGFCKMSKEDIFSPCPLACGITHITAHFVESISIDFVSDLFHIITTLALSGICLTVDFVRLHRENMRKGQTEL